MPVLVRLLLLPLCFAAFAVSAADTAPKKVMPANFPELTANYGTYWLESNGSGLESGFTILSVVNRKLLGQIRDYTPESIAVILGERMKRERNVHLKLILAAWAAANGNEAARDYNLRSRPA